MQDCAHCGVNRKCRKRDFSNQAWAALIVWGEIEEPIISSSICEECYRDLRDILIERSDEMAQTDFEQSLKQLQADPLKKKKKIASKVA